MIFKWNYLELDPLFSGIKIIKTTYSNTELFSKPNVNKVKVSLNNCKQLTANALTVLNQL